MTTAAKPAEPVAPPSAIWTELVTLRSRFAFSFSASGRVAGALVTDGRGWMFPEFWRFDGPDAGCEAIEDVRFTVGDIPVGGFPSETVAFDDGHLLVLRKLPERFDLLAVTVDGAQRPVGSVPLVKAFAVPWPDGSPRALLYGRRPDGGCAAWSVDPEAAAVTPIAELPPLELVGGGWLDPDGRRFLLNRAGDGHIVPLVFDLAEGATEPVDGVTDATGLLAAPSGHVLLGVPEGRSAGLRWGRPGGPWHPLTDLALPGRQLRPISLHPGGRHLAVLDHQGVRLSMRIVDLDDGTGTTLSAPDGAVLNPLVWLGEHAVRCMTVAPGRPAGVAELSEDGHVLHTDGTTSGESARWHGARPESFDGPAGEIEAIVYGEQDWRAAGHVAIALHGGPQDMWRLKFDQLFQLCAEEGVTVVAVNPRGSKGYGVEHRDAVIGAWGGPDLDDVLAVAGFVSAQRGGDRLGLYGCSYGGFLALLAATTAPELWSSVVAAAPFLSGESLYGEATETVRRHVEHLRGREPVTDEWGVRAVPERLHRLTAPLLVLHGDADDRVPVTQSRRLAELLAEQGHEFVYREVPGAGHGVLDGSEALHRMVARFLTSGVSPAPEPTAQVGR